MVSSADLLKLAHFWNTCRMNDRFTHQLAVLAFVVFDDQFLLLKRVNEPKVWGPPGGRLYPDENPNLGVLREVKEETGLDIELITPAHIWFGPYGENNLVSIDYLARANRSDVILSPEHAEFQWAGIGDLRNRRPPLAETPPAFLLDDFEKIWALYCRLNHRRGDS